MRARGLPVLQITIETDGGPWADHDMPCAICRTRHAVINVATGRFDPCWGCQEDGWRTVRRRGLLRKDERA